MSTREEVIDKSTRTESFLWWSTIIFSVLLVIIAYMLVYFGYKVGQAKRKIKEEPFDQDLKTNKTENIEIKNNVY